MRYAIVDGAHRPHFYEQLEKLSVPYRSLFAGTAEEALKGIAPLLLEHAGDLMDGSPLSRALRNLGERKPAVSLIESDASIDALAMHFCDFHLIRVPEQSGRDMLLRWYDTRILPVWLQLLHPEQKAAFVGDIGQWRYYDRFGDMQELSLPEPLVEAFPALPPLRLDDQQYNRFLKACEADVLIAHLQQIIRDELKRVQMRELYPFVCRHLNGAREHGLNDLDDHAQYLLLALYTSGKFLEHPIVQSRLGRPAAEQNEAFRDWVLNLPEEIDRAGTPIWAQETVVERVGNA